MLSKSSTAVAALALVHFASAQSSGLPIVNLGYELHQANNFNSTGGYYNFSNIRYAEPPVGDLRFRAPIPVGGSGNTSVNTGNIGVVCPQASPGWGPIADKFYPDYLKGIAFNLTATEAANNASKAKTPAAPADGRTTEDCLFLDVVVPQKVFNSTNGTSGAPVMVWFSGGYTFGDKSQYTGANPAGLMKAGQDEMIYVSFNSRLGAFGWLAGPTLQSDGLANAGLYDQMLALEWVQQNIHLFGGDPNRVSAVGEASGAGAIMHLITSFGGLSGPLPFQQALLQSPEFQLLPGSYQQEQVYDDFLSLLDVNTTAEARQLSSSDLIAASKNQVVNSAYAYVTYGPVVDGLITPALPGKLLLQGSYDKDLKIMVGYNANEGLAFTYPDYVESDYEKVISTFFLDLDPAIADYLTNTLYPPVFDGSHGYTDEISRLALTISEYEFDCNAVYLDKAFGNDTYSYVFSIPPAIHGEDIDYTYYNGPNPTNVENDTTAQALQDYITSFVINGVPSASGIPKFPLYGNDSEVVNLNLTSITDFTDPHANARCAWWQKGLVY